MRIRTICAWCGALISERECPDMKNCQALSNDGIMISHGICQACKKSVEIQYGLNNKEGETNV